MDVPIGWQPETFGTETPLLLNIPPGYPDSFRYVDVTIKDTAGHSALWRVSGLPKMPHLLFPAAPGQEQFTFAGCTLRGRAWKHPSQFKGECCVDSKSDYVSASWIEGKPVPTGNWDVEQHPADMKNFTRREFGRTRGYSMVQIDPKPGQNANTDLGILQGKLMYPDVTPWIKIYYEIHRYMYMDEIVTFHNIPVRQTSWFYTISAPKTLSRTTASGVTIKIFPYKPGAAGVYPAGQGSVIYCQIELPDSVAPGKLPLSPLVKKYHLPVLLDTRSVGAPFVMTGWNWSPWSPAPLLMHDLSICTTQPVGKTIPSLSFVIRQRCNLQTLPAALTIPIEAKEPAGHSLQ